MFSREVIQQGIFEREQAAKDWLKANAANVQKEIRSNVPTFTVRIRVPEFCQKVVMEELTKLGFIRNSSSENFLYLQRAFWSPPKMDYQSEYFDRGFSARKVWNEYRLEHNGEQDKLALQCQEEMKKNRLTEHGYTIVHPANKFSYLFIEDVTMLIFQGGAFKANVTSCGNIVISDPSHPKHDQKFIENLLKC